MIAPNHNVSISSSDLEAVNPDLASSGSPTAMSQDSSADSDSLTTLRVAESIPVGSLTLEAECDQTG
jgi:hypothetical protein